MSPTDNNNNNEVAFTERGTEVTKSQFRILKQLGAGGYGKVSKSQFRILKQLGAGGYGKVTKSQFRILKQLGAGGYGKVSKSQFRILKQLGAGGYGKVTKSQFRILKQLGAGGYGKVSKSQFRILKQLGAGGYGKVTKSQFRILKQLGAGGYGKVSKSQFRILKQLGAGGYGKVTKSQFRILKQLGAGGYGKVHLVRKTCGTDAETQYAMKVIKKASLCDTAKVHTKSERDILTELSHPFLVQMHYAFQTKGKLFMVFDFLRGGDMLAMLSRKKYFTESEVEFYSAELALAVSHLHSLSIVHRDLKPDNVLIGADGHVVLTDFGLSKKTADLTYSYCGTIEYMSPEIITGDGHTTSSDWWSFGALIFRLITGKPLFRGANKYRISQAIVYGVFDLPYYLSEEAASLIVGLVVKKPSNRLGAGPKGMINLQRHPFYEATNWEKLSQKKVPPPFMPQLTGDDDTSCFKSKYTEAAITDSDGIPVPKKANAIFQNFDYVCSVHKNSDADASTDQQESDLLQKH